MKIVRIAAILLLFCAVAVIINAFVLQKTVRGFISEVEAIDDEGEAVAEEYNRLADKFKRAEVYMGLTVNHEDLCDVETAFAEAVGAAKANDTEALSVTKSRLICSLEHIRRFAGINLESIF